MNNAEPEICHRPSLCHLLQLRNDEMCIITHKLCDPLRPHPAVYLSSTTKGLRAMMQTQLLELMRRHGDVKALTAYMGCYASYAELQDETHLAFGSWSSKHLTVAHWRTLGSLAHASSLLALEALELGDMENRGLLEGLELFASGLCCGSLPSLQILSICDANFGDKGASVLAPALTNQAMPALMFVGLKDLQIGDAGMGVLSSVLRKLPNLRSLDLGNNRITDQGLAYLLTFPYAKTFAVLRALGLWNNLITDEGCGALGDALCSGALPALDQLILVLDNEDPSPASHAGVAGALAALFARRG